ncbi:uncharacterized protein LOC131614071 [Vicia villosa]|uniref:uncharacterized protein LOC131614071 n=1 Tax=Vicia villosa TaxID=3911 RepID=UPI00273CBC0D|nr:uncharacterized protein LOC131614071 [Vicia villosa]
MAATTGATTQTEEHVSLKLLLNEKGNKVLFAEAGKDFVDILCSFLTMPLGTIARLVEKESSIGPVTLGCLNSLYQSVADLDGSCFYNDAVKQMLLKPSNFAEDYCNTLKLNIDDTPPTMYWACSYNSTCGLYSGLTVSTNNRCRCGYSLTGPVFPKHYCQGFVNGVATFVITDDLIVMPSCIDYSSFGLLLEFGIKNTSLLKERVLNVTKQKVLDLLKCSLLSNATLTNLFLGKKPSIEVSRFLSPDVELNGSLQIILKLVIRKSDGKVLCAQGEQDFANLLLSFLTLPLGGATRIFGKNCSMGSINELYKSMTELNENKYFISKDPKNRLVDPWPCISPHLKLCKEILPILQPGLTDYYYENGYGVQYFKAGEDTSFFGTLKKLNVSNLRNIDSYMKGPALYVVTDDLVVAPLSPISALGLLNQFKTPLNDLKEKVITIGVKESISILKAGLTSTSALTNGLAHLLNEVKEEK